MASPQFVLLQLQDAAAANATADPSKKEDNNNNSTTTEMDAIDSDGRLLTEENPVRLTLIQFNALAEMQFAHIIDDYTFLEGKRNAPRDHSVFKEELKAHFARIRPASPEAMDALWQQVFGHKNNQNNQNKKKKQPPPQQQEEEDNNNNKDAQEEEQQQLLPSSGGSGRLYERAVCTQKRVVDNLTVPSCKRCNKAMDRIYSHVLATYRCFPLTRESEVPELEGRDTTSVMAARVVQQIAIYFSPPPPSSLMMRWSPKTDHDLLCDANLWRCIAHLWNWGQSPLGGGVRFRMIAVFHASHFVYLNSRMRGVLPFETWHVHIWRPFLMDTFPRANTFFGMEQVEATAEFDLPRAKRGARWDANLRAQLMRIVSQLDDDDDADDQVERIIQFEQGLAKAAIVDEAGLVLHLREKYSGETAAALSVLLEYFRYNLSDGNASAFLLRRCDALQAELVRTSAILAHRKKKHHHRGYSS